MRNNGVGERHRLYTECRSELLNRQLSNSEHFDKSVLSLSSAMLGASIAFIRPSGPDAPTHHAALLAWSWIALAVAVGTTMLSFMVSQKAVDRQLALADMYYLKEQEDALTSPNRPATWTVRLNWFAGIAFALGVALTVWFAIANIPTR